MKKLAIKLLFKLIGSPISMTNSIDEERIRKWIGDVYPLKEFRDYIYKRDLEILKLLGGVVSREDYLIYIGQRAELGRLLTNAKEAFDKLEKDRKNKK